MLFDRLQPSPDERASGSETGSQARDVLASLPPRRRAVMLLRYGWGLEPSEVCRLIDGLSPRAYRKEITRGVEQMIARFRQLESGEWCATREPLLRDYVAGVADDDERRQAVEHMSHCRHCNELVGRLSAELHELGGGVAAWTMLAGALAERGDGLGDRLGTAVERVRHLLPWGGDAASPASASVPPRAPAAPGLPAPACSPSSAAPGPQETSRSPALASGRSAAPASPAARSSCRAGAGPRTSASPAGRHDS